MSKYTNTSAGRAARFLFDILNGYGVIAAITGAAAAYAAMGIADTITGIMF